MNDSPATIEMCLYNGCFLEYVHKARFVTIQLGPEPSKRLTIEKIWVESLKSGGSYQGFARLDQYKTEKRFRLPLALAETIIDLSVITVVFNTGDKHSSLQESPWAEFFTAVARKLREILY